MRREKPRDWTRYPEICDLIAGKTPGRTNDKQITFFLNNVGTGVQFAAMGYCAYEGAKEKGLAAKSPRSGFSRTSSLDPMTVSASSHAGDSFWAGAIL